MAAKIRLVDGRELVLALSGKKIAEALEAAEDEKRLFLQANSPVGTRVWVNPRHVTVVEDRPDLG